MAVKKRRNCDWIIKVDAELEKWPGVTAFRQFGGNRHNRIVLSYGDRTRFVVYPGTPSKRPTALLNHIQDVRRALRELGAERTCEKRNLTTRKKLPTDPPSETNHRETNL